MTRGKRWSRRDILKATGAASALTGTGALTPASSRASDATPNVLYILVDQLRAHALSCYGELNIETPHLELFHRFDERRGTAENVLTHLLDLLGGDPISDPIIG